MGTMETEVGMTMEEKRKHVTRRVKGGLLTMPFILGNDVAEKLAVVGFGANMITYLTKELNMPLTQAANTLTNFSGTASLTPLLGAFIADAFAGKFWTLTVASIIYQIVKLSALNFNFFAQFFRNLYIKRCCLSTQGMVCLTISAVLPQLRPWPCGNDPVCQQANSGQLAILYGSLLLTAIGAGGIRPCAVAFGADQFDESDPKQKTWIWKYFNWYYFSMGVSILLAVTVLVYIQDNVGWGWGLGIPTIFMFMSVIVFILGYPLYRNLDPVGSPFTRLIQVSVAAFKKRKLSCDMKCLYENDQLDGPISNGGKLLHSNQLKFLDKAAIVTEEDDTSSPNLWRLNTVHRVEELKCIIRMGPIWASGIILITAYAQQGTFSLQQAKTMNRRLSNSFEIPAASMSVFTYISMLLTIIFYDRVFIPITRKLTGLNRGITFLQRMGIGFTISILATFIAGLVELKRKQVASAHDLISNPKNLTLPISVFWLVPQYTLHGIAEAFMSIGHLEFFYDQAPESMRSTATALFWTSISMGNYVSSLLVSLVHKLSARADGSNWLPNRNLNKGKLEYFYWLITALQVVNFVYYLCCAMLYNLKPLQVQAREVVDDGDSREGTELITRHV